MHKFRKIISLLMVIMLLAGLFTVNALAENSDYCWGTESNTHVAGDYHDADYNDCTGGYKTGVYECVYCCSACDYDGNYIPRLEGNGSHTKGEEMFTANYTECGGGYKNDFYRCSVCGIALNEDGTPASWTPSVSDSKHTAGDLYSRADYTECGGGYKKDAYLCSKCGDLCDREGNRIMYTSGAGKHTPDLSVTWDKYYTECGGGYMVEHYVCSICHLACDAAGNDIEWVGGTAPHSPSAEEYPVMPNCYGGPRVPHHICTVCGTPVDSNGAYIESYPPTEDHTLVTVPAKAATVDAEGNIEHFKCTVCNSLFLTAEDVKFNCSCMPDVVTLPKLTAEAPAQKVEIAETVDEVPAAIADKYESVEQMSQEMTLVALDKNVLGQNVDEAVVKTELIDVTLMVETDNGWVPVTEENFPAAGVTVTLPYPDGVDRATHVFAIAHMITTGDKAGEVEIVPCTPTANGLVATFHSLSPVMIIYREKTADELIAPLPGGAAKTGDEGMVGLWMAVMAVSAAGVVLLISKKSRASKR